MNGDCWRVYYVYNCRHASPRKNKYVITFQHSADIYLGIFINSQMTNFAWNSPNIRPCIVQLYAEVDTYLHHDSYANCSSVNEFHTDELNNFKGFVSDQGQEDIKQAVIRCGVIKHKWRSSILDSIS